MIKIYLILLNGSVEWVKVLTKSVDIALLNIRTKAKV